MTSVEIIKPPKWIELLGRIYSVEEGKRYVGFVSKKLELGINDLYNHVNLLIKHDFIYREMLSKPRKRRREYLMLTEKGQRAGKACHDLMDIYNLEVKKNGRNKK